jgi:hypothetical protein
VPAAKIDSQTRRTPSLASAPSCFRRFETDYDGRLSARENNSAPRPRDLGMNSGLNLRRRGVPAKEGNII